MTLCSQLVRIFSQLSTLSLRIETRGPRSMTTNRNPETLPSSRVTLFS